MKHTLLLPAVFLLAGCNADKSQSPPPEANADTIDIPRAQYIPQPPALYIDTAAFRLYRDTAGFTLRNLNTRHDYHIPVAWLTPPKSIETEENEDQLIKYDSTVTAFQLGKNLLGIHLSSYFVASGGSMALAQGLDVFVAVDTVNKKVLRDVLHLGITKQRGKFMGYFDAQYTEFSIGQVGSSYFSLGMIQEKIGMHWDNDRGIPDSGPFYEQTPLRWYVFDGKKWTYAPSLDRRWPMGGCTKLPMLSLRMTPVELAKEAYRTR
jgi:hypothetical protein